MSMLWDKLGGCLFFSCFQIQAENFDPRSFQPWTQWIVYMVKHPINPSEFQGAVCCFFFFGLLVSILECIFIQKRKERNQYFFWMHTWKKLGKLFYLTMLQFVSTQYSQLSHTSHQFYTLVKVAKHWFLSTPNFMFFLCSMFTVEINWRLCFSGIKYSSFSCFPKLSFSCKYPCKTVSLIFFFSEWVLFI